ncbi:3-oxo-5-alpha-steroid 4-dehydrogenase-domain-containing protein [Gilbertella persicaria]|uniref:3-oxo-5-alpha-steroid 4-dehydrogenase-domain-containing protein n=1 Tax=Gilbertella persicaria TaxID=101096 RepID=UPI00221FE974|nr:3-oxo-5-alpha-steroid 4-dehydrogenase-domain-containing protein [Gilbertella persicaria]KAI8095011.1 3-oxo-5-alpha-steroid 4-dehydrogenase-domain-containing protein [Gilbertella persicaria]
MGYTSSIGLYVPDWTKLNWYSLIIGISLALFAFVTLFIDLAPYSKFGNRKFDTIPSKKAMICFYLPSVIACLFVQKPVFFYWHSHFDIVHLLNTLHFSKRVFEVCFVHIYKSNTNILTMLSVSSVYTTTTLLDLLVIRQMPDYAFSDKLFTCGLLFFFIGEAVNTYHHWVLRQMRMNNNSQEKYRLPRGGLFDYVVAPHYMGEQLSFIGFILTSQNVVALALKAFPLVYLSIRAKKTHAWYKAYLTDKHEKADIRKRKNLIPFVW